MKTPIGTTLWTVLGVERCGGLFNSRLFSRCAITWLSARLFVDEASARLWAKEVAKGFVGNPGNTWQLIVHKMTRQDGVAGVSCLPERYTPVHDDCVNPEKTS